tara:strand:- start:1357 stop:1506 length:150 start_codon:yes stop_codon:yes gene_type:complete
MKTQRDDIKKQISLLQVQLSHSVMMGDTENQKLFENKIFWLKSTLTHIQ